jgi:DNA-directed RNA polymerase subunit RPC12/RpoP
MAIDIRCPNCGKAFHASESFAGLRIRCPACATKVLVPAPPRPGQGPPPEILSPAVPDQISAKPLPPTPTGVRPPLPVHGGAQGEVTAGLWTPDERPLIDGRWRLVGVGLLLVQIGVLLGIVGYAAGLFGPMAFLERPGVARRALETMALAIALIAGGSLLLAGLLVVVGQGLCAAVPDASGGKGAARLSFVLTLLAALLAGVLAVVAFAARGDPPVLRDSVALQALALSVVVTAFVGHVFFVLFLREVATFAKRQQAADLARSYLALCALAVVFNVVESLKPAAMGSGVRFAIAVGALVVALIFFTLLSSVVNAVRTYLRHGGRAPDE